MKTENSAPFDAMLRRLGGAGPVVLGLVQLVKLTRGRDRFFTGAEAMAIFQGKLTVSSVVEARARGLQDADVNPANEDANIVAERELGAGKAGTVVELTRSDGTSVVFKGGVLEGDGWLDRAERPLGTGDITVRKQDGGTKRLGGTIALNIHILSCPSYFARDLFDRLFA